MALVPLVLYTAAAIVYGVHFARRAPRPGRGATAVLSAGVLAHTFLIGMQTRGTSAMSQRLVGP